LKPKLLIEQLTTEGVFFGFYKNGAGNRIRTGDPDLGKVVLYQLSYSRYISLVEGL
jgi:hypothetical protein